MDIRNFEFKARVDNPGFYENKLKDLKPEFIGTDNQTDTYFNVAEGRLKLREGNIENSLISYHRQNVAGSKLSEVILFRHEPDVALKKILEHHLGIKTVVKKSRRIYFIGNVKFHFDTVDGLGSFVEVEAIDSNGKFTTEELREQCNKYLDFFGIDKAAIESKSYSDMLLEK